MRASSRVRMALLCIAAFSAVAAAPAPHASAAGLDSRVDALVRGSSVRASTSVFVWDQTSRDVLYTYNAGRRVAPASTMKLLTSAAALAHFGPSHRFSTRVALDGRQIGATWVGDVWLVGGGDPSLSTGGFARDNYGGRGTNIGNLVAPLRSRGIRAITGRVRVDDSMLDELRWVPEWERQFRFVETGALGALTVNQSQTGRWIGGRSAREPDLHAGTIYRELLSRGGISVRGGVAAGTLSSTANVVATALSPPLGTLLHHMNQASDNFYAEILLKDIGADEYGRPEGGSTAAGRRAASIELSRLGIDMSTVRWLDGSGLAYGNRLTARNVGHILGVGAQATWGEQWIDSFARAGVSGTLRKRMIKAPFRGRIAGKTGTLTHASALSGFSARLGSDKRFGFVSLTWNSSGRSVSYSAARTLQDRIAMTLVR